jgi:FlaA1/EpsC-like NDP-sugar epimerase
LGFTLDEATLASLLGRRIDSVHSAETARFVADKRILITGAGGSIGSEIVRQLMGLGAHELYFLDNDEYALYTLSLSLEGSAMLNASRYILGNVSNRAKVNAVFKAVRPDIVFHAAACKHLPLIENSPEAAVLTNVMGTDIISTACVEYGVSHFVNVSTDKAANPTSILGMTKRLAEMITLKSNNGVTRSSSVRFGNVLGSRGSYLETLDYQLERGLPTELTHPEATRYFMTIPEASGLVIEAARLAQTGETFVLDMGTSVKIVDMIKRYATLTGRPEPVIIHKRLRPGEKIKEEIYDWHEQHSRTAHPRISHVHVEHADRIDLNRIRMLYIIAQVGEEIATLKSSIQRLTDKNRSIVTSSVAEVS